MKQLKRWLRNITVSLGLTLLMVPSAYALSLPSFDTAELGDAEIMGSNGGQLAKGRFSSEDGFSAHTAQPLTAEGTPITTLDGTLSDSVQLTSESSDAFLTIFIQPASTGDIATLISSQDLNMDGTADYNFSPGDTVSGVCADGLILCDPGTWSNCEYRAWEANEDGELNLALAAMADLGGCYCINNFCGNNLVFSNVSIVLKNIGGGAAGAIQRANPQYQITRTELNANEMTILFYGQDMGSNRVLADGTFDTGSVDEVKYFSKGGGSPYDIDGDAEVEAINQQGDPDSNYSIMLEINQDIGSNRTESSCTINRVINILTDTVLCTDPYPDGVVVGEKIHHDYYKVKDRRVKIHNDDCDIGKRPQDFPQYHYTPDDGPTYTVSVPPTDSEDIGEVDYVYIDCDHDDGSDDGIYDIYAFHLLCTKTYDIIVESVNDGCNGLEANPDCSVVDEEADGVQIITRGGSTGLSPQPSVHYKTGSLRNYPITRNWWRKERTYACTTTNESQYGNILTRVNTIEESADQNNNNATTVNFNDARYDEELGTWTIDSGSFEMRPGVPTENCEFVCKTRKPVHSTEVTYSATADQERADSDTMSGNQIYEFFYKTCIDNSCPVGSGEELLKECACLDEFAEATAILETLNSAGKDIICSDGVRK